MAPRRLTLEHVVGCQSVRVRAECCTVAERNAASLQNGSLRSIISFIDASIGEACVQSVAPLQAQRRVAPRPLFAVSSILLTTSSTS